VLWPIKKPLHCGNYLLFDVVACKTIYDLLALIFCLGKKHGLEHMQRVQTPRGKGVVIGVYENNLWYHLDSDKGATYWQDGDGTTFRMPSYFKIYPCEQEPEFQGPKMPPSWHMLKAGMAK